ncbi:probable G-protein coupled receptor 139 [Callorhinchus milii]|uniref:probable G-protein coupled receptor 139 n=1 Tax=Callorhinchus milii TaxID=7868 RepID=UPI001C3F974F|nr:probable G-protein coupled receptor 139 [Callorhinchus milii]
MVILSRGGCGLSKCITRYLVSMAAADLMVIVNGVVLNRVRANFPAGSFLDLTPVHGFRLVLLQASTDVSVWLTVSFTFDRFLAICCRTLAAQCGRARGAVVAIASVNAFFCLKNIPMYFTCEASYVVGDVRWGCALVADYYTSWAWAVYDWVHNVLTPFLPCLLILLLNAMTVRHIVVASRARGRLRGHGNGGKEKDPEMESRRRSIVLLFSISGSFVLLWMTYMAQVVYYRTVTSDYAASRLIFKEVGYMLLFLSCCTNTCIYTVTQRLFRQKLFKMATYPFSRFIK